MPAPVYRQRNPQSTPYYQCIEDHFEAFERVYEDRFERQYGFYRPYVKHLGFHPHLHILISDGCFHKNGMFSVSPYIDTDVLERIFRHMVLKMLLAKGKIRPEVIALMDKWRHTGFNV